MLCFAWDNDDFFGQTFGLGKLQVSRTVCFFQCPNLLVKCCIDGCCPKVNVRDAQGVAPLGIGVLRTHTSLP